MFMHQPVKVAHGVTNALAGAFVHLLAGVLCLKWSKHQNCH